MSNLYKRPFVVGEEYPARVINSNELIERRLRELQSQQSVAPSQQPEDGFTPGLDAPEVEAIPEIDYVAEAQAEAERLLEEAKEQAAAIRQEAESDIEHIKQQAQEEGFQKGYEEGSTQAEQELAVKRRELEEKKQELLENYEKQLAEMEPQLLEVILQVVEKVFHIQFADKKEILLYLLSNAINGIEGCKHFQIRVGHENYQFVSDHKDEIKARISDDISIEVLSDTVLEEDKCMIETDVGVFDCSLGVQLENLIKTLRSLCA